MKYWTFTPDRKQQIYRRVFIQDTEPTNINNRYGIDTDVVSNDKPDSDTDIKVGRK